MSNILRVQTLLGTLCNTLRISERDALLSVAITPQANNYMYLLSNFALSFAVDGPIMVYFKIPVSEISKIDDQRSVSTLFTLFIRYSRVQNKQEFRYLCYQQSVLFCQDSMTQFGVIALVKWTQTWFLAKLLTSGPRSKFYTQMLATGSTTQS